MNCFGKSPTSISLSLISFILLDVSKSANNDLIDLDSEKTIFIRINIFQEERYPSSNQFYRTSCRLVSLFRLKQKPNVSFFFYSVLFRRFSHYPILFITCTNDLISPSLPSSSLSIRRASLLCWSVLFSLILF